MGNKIKVVQNTCWRLVLRFNRTISSN